MLKSIRSLTQFSLLAAAMAIPAIAQSAAGSIEDYVFWPRRDFIIPFQVDLTGETPAEIQLEYSEDHGKTWNLYTRSDVRGKQFNFHSFADGEYYFRLKTLDRNGRIFENPGEPLKVLVDTTKPTGELEIFIDKKGQMMAEFRLSDAALDFSSLRLEFQTDLSTSWSEVAVETVPGAVPNEWVGTANWSIAHQTQQMVVRLVVKDRAGNTLEITRMPQLPRSAAVQNPNLKLASNQGQYAVPIGSGVPKQPQQSPSESAHPKSTQPTKPRVEILGGPGAKTFSQVQDSELAAKEKILQEKDRLIELQNKFIAQQDAISRLKLGQPGGQISDSVGIAVPTADDFANRQNRNASSGFPTRPLSNEEIEQAGSGMTRTAMLPNSKDSRSLLNSNIPNMGIGGDPRTAVDVRSNSGTRAPDTSQESFQGQNPRTNPVPTSRDKPEAVDGITQPKVNSPSNAKSHQPLFSRSKKFSLDYAIENDPGAPIASVELWGTLDGGDTWELWGTDPDNASPFDIEVLNEGLFGFRMVIVGANGLASNRPHNGDDADAWIHVDLQEPFARLNSAAYGKGNETGSLILEYQAGDDYFPDRPISFFYSESPKGPWTRIASGVRNNGRYQWQTDPSLPSKVFLRMEAMDAAGNVGISQLDIPVDIQGLAPRGRIQGFRPIAN